MWCMLVVGNGQKKEGIQPEIGGVAKDKIPIFFYQICAEEGESTEPLVKVSI